VSGPPYPLGTVSSSGSRRANALGGRRGPFGVVVAIPRRLSNPAIAFPLDFGHFARDHLDIKRSKAAGTAFPSFERNLIMPGRQRNTEMSLVVGGKFRCHGVLFVLHDETCIGKRTGARCIDWDRARMNRIKGNYSFDACFCSGRILPGSETSAHNRQNEHES
jgi:hypothetical protein